MSRGQKILFGAFIGAAIGSGFGIAGGGDAIAATVPFAVVTVIITYLYTRPTPPGTPTPMEELRIHAVPFLLRGLGWVWNFLMRMLVIIRLMPTCTRYPWVLAVVIFMLMAVLPFLSWLFAAVGMYALHREVKAENQFIIES